MYNDELRLIFKTKTGNEYSTREDAEADVLENMSQEEFFYAFAFVVSWNQLLKWVVKQDSFYETFKDEIAEANQMVFDDNITVHEVENF